MIKYVDMSCFSMDSNPCRDLLSFDPPDLSANLPPSLISSDRGPVSPLDTGKGWYGRVGRKFPGRVSFVNPKNLLFWNSHFDIRLSRVVKRTKVNRFEVFFSVRGIF